MTAPSPAWTVPEGYLLLSLGYCKGCGEPIAWALTRMDRRAPLDRDGTSHFATCPVAARFRRRTRKP
jgi:hypothetical protein